MTFLNASKLHQPDAIRALRWELATNRVKHHMDPKNSTRTLIGIRYNFTVRGKLFECHLCFEAVFVVSRGRRCTERRLVRREQVLFVCKSEAQMLDACLGKKEGTPFWTAATDLSLSASTQSAGLTTSKARTSVRNISIGNLRYLVYVSGHIS